MPKLYKIENVEEMVQMQREKEKIREETKLSRINESMMSINSIKSTIKDAQGLMSIKRIANLINILVHNYFSKIMII